MSQTIDGHCIARPREVSPLPVGPQTAQDFVSHHHEHQITLWRSWRYLPGPPRYNDLRSRVPNGLPENCSTTNCKGQPPIEDNGFCDITFQQFCRGKYDQNAFLRSSCAMNTGMLHFRASSVQRSIMYTASAPCLCGVKAVCRVFQERGGSFSNQMHPRSLRKVVRQLMGRNSLRPLGCVFFGLRDAMTRNHVS